MVLMPKSLILRCVSILVVFLKILHIFFVSLYRTMSIFFVFILEKDTL